MMAAFFAVFALALVGYRQLGYNFKSSD